MTTSPTDPLERLGDMFASLEASGERRRLLVIVNPHATGVNPRLRGLIAHALASRYEVTAIDTQRQGHARELTREAVAEGYDAVVVYSGDGTINEAANALAGSEVPLTCLPGGATNVFCRQLGIPPEIVDATEHLLRLADDWRVRRVDLGRVNGRYFTFASGYGLDAAVVKSVDLRPVRKHRFGQWYFAWSAIRTYASDYFVRPRRVVVEVDGRTLPGVTAVVQNGEPLTFFGDRPLHAAEGATLDGGTLAGVVARRALPHDVPTIAARLLSQRLRIVDHRHVDAFAGQTTFRAYAEDGRPIALEVDGDWIGDVAEAEYGIEPLALAVVG